MSRQSHPSQAVRILPLCAQLQRHTSEHDNIQVSLQGTERMCAPMLSSPMLHKSVSTLIFHNLMIRVQRGLL
jgi:hypothetical protein